MSNTENRRKLSNIAVDPKAQLRFGQPFAVLLITSIGTVMILFYQIFSIRGEMGNSVQAQDLAVLNGIISKVVTTASLGMGLMGLLAVSMWIYFSHRIFGPVVPIRRQIQNIMKGDFSGEIHLRKNDELREVADDLNLLTRQMREKLGKT